MRGVSWRRRGWRSDSRRRSGGGGGAAADERRTTKSTHKDPVRNEELDKADTQQRELCADHELRPFPPGLRVRSTLLDRLLLPTLHALILVEQAVKYQVKVHDDVKQDAGCDRSDGQRDGVQEGITDGGGSLAEVVVAPPLCITAVVCAVDCVGEPLVRSCIVGVTQAQRKRQHECEDEGSHCPEHGEQLLNVVG